MTQRDKAYEQRDRSRSAYFSACEAVESARQKRASAKEGRDTDKASRAYDAAYSEMLLAKDQYLVDLDGANVAKQRIYAVHLPHLIDEYQQLEASAVKQLEDLLGRMLEIQTESEQKVLRAVETAKQVLSGIDVEADQQAFVAQHAGTLMAAYEHPPDLLFEECPVWHDTASPRLLLILDVLFSAPASPARVADESLFFSLRATLSGRVCNHAGSHHVPPERQGESPEQDWRDIACDRDEAERSRIFAELEGYV